MTNVKQDGNKLLEILKEKTISTNEHIHYVLRPLILTYFSSLILVRQLLGECSLPLPQKIKWPPAVGNENVEFGTKRIVLLNQDSL